MPDSPATNALPAGHEEVVFSLFEGDYHLGLAALINSLLRAGFRGLFWIGCRGSLPSWTASLPRRSDGLFEVGGALLGFESITSSRHFGQFKPEFFLSLIDRGIATKFLWYFDPDITVRCDWEFFERWARYGVCLCEDGALTHVSARHPFRAAWTEMAREAGWGEPVNPQEWYFNSGFVGMDVAHRAFPAQWKAAVDLANRNGVDPGRFQNRKRYQLFATVDQDCLNIAAMYAPVPFSTLGPEAMGFSGSGIPMCMYHAMGKLKPWRRKFLREALRGFPPSAADKHFVVSIDGPIRPVSRASHKALRARVALANLLTRFWRRS